MTPSPWECIGADSTLRGPSAVAALGGSRNRVRARGHSASSPFRSYGRGLAPCRRLVMHAMARNQNLQRFARPLEDRARRRRRPAWENASPSFIKDLAAHRVHGVQWCAPSFRQTVANGVTTESQSLFFVTGCVAERLPPSR